MPIRWLPSEAAVEDDFSSKSDVWSFAVLIWEVVYQAAMPFPSLTNEQVLSSLERKEQLWCNKSDFERVGPRGLQKLMSQCLDLCPRDRPSFSSVVVQLSEILKESVNQDK